MCTERWEHVNYISVIAYIIQPYNQRSYTMGTKGDEKKKGRARDQCVTWYCCMYELYIFGLPRAGFYGDWMNCECNGKTH